VLRPPGDSVDHAVEALLRYAETFLDGFGGGAAGDE
jgi:hypothetical protein